MFFTTKFLSLQRKKDNGSLTSGRCRLPVIYDPSRLFDGAALGAAKGGVSPPRLAIFPQGEIKMRPWGQRSGLTHLLWDLSQKGKSWPLACTLPRRYSEATSWLLPTTGDPRPWAPPLSRYPPGLQSFPFGKTTGGQRPPFVLGHCGVRSRSWRLPRLGPSHPGSTSAHPILASRARSGRPHPRPREG